MALINTVWLKIKTLKGLATVSKITIERQTIVKCKQTTFLNIKLKFSEAAFLKLISYAITVCTVDLGI